MTQGGRGRRGRELPQEAAARFRTTADILDRSVPSTGRGSRAAQTLAPRGARRPGNVWPFPARLNLYLPCIPATLLDVPREK